MTIGTEVDQRTDVYLLGAILHELLTGRPPHHGDTLQAVLYHAYDSPTPELPESTPAELAELCLTALAREPGERMPGAGDFREGLERYLLHRASISLSERALEQLDRVTARFAALDGDAGLAPLRSELDDCRFAFRQALDEWEGNPGAIEGMACWADLAVKLELRAENLAGAEAALALLIDPDVELVRRAEALRTHLNRARGEADRHTGAGVRKRLAYIFAGCGAVISVVALDLLRQDSFTPDDTTRIAWIIAAVTGVALVFGRTWIRSSAYNSKFTALGVLVVLTLVVHRHAAVAAGSGVHEILAEDCLLLASMFAVAAVTMARWIALCAALFGLAALVTMIVPSMSPLIFSLSVVVGLLIAAAAFSRDVREDTSSG